MCLLQQQSNERLLGIEGIPDVWACVGQDQEAAWGGSEEGMRVS